MWACTHWTGGTRAALALLLLAAPATAQPTCLTPLLPDEPLCSPALADSAWPISHHGPYAQGSSPLPGPVAGQTVQAEHIDLTGPPITLAISPEYADGDAAVWGAVLGLTNAVVKIDSGSFTLIDAYVPADEEVDPPPIPLGVSGAYSVVDRDFHFILGRAQFVEVYGDSVPGDRSSPIALVKRVFLPASAFCRASDLLVGGVMLPDGHLAFVTEQAAVGVIPSDPVAMEAANVVSLPSENGADCGNGAIPDGDLETVSNSIAADENGGIYVVTDRALIKYQWDGAALTRAWRADYASDPPFSVLRLGPGSGSTPSLMGTAVDDDRFVVITDGQELMHLVLMWRDEIPAGWQPIAPGKDPRIACEFPVTFGDPGATRTLSEQSVLVRGYASVVVNNLLADESNVQNPIPALAAALAALEGGNPAVAPVGAERIDWDPLLRTCRSVWSNPTVSLPNGIPTMSQATDLMYAIGQRQGVWGLEALDFATGVSRFFVPSAQTTCSQAVIDGVAGSILGPVLSPVIERLPASCENSIFAATEIAADGAIYTGTFQGASRFVPDAVVTVPPRQQAVTGVRQGIDLARRGLAAAGVDAPRAHDATRRGDVQLDATLAVIAAAAANDALDPASAAGATAHTSAARARFAAAAPLVDGDPLGAAAELTGGWAELEAALDWLTPCPPAPQAQCRPAAKSALLIRGGPRPKTGWQWSSPDDVDPTLLPDPTAGADYALCLYAGTAGARLAALDVPGNRDAWTVSRQGDQLRYKDRSGGAAGVTRLTISEAANRARVLLRAKGTALPLPSLPAAAPIVAQLVNSESGLCWQATYDVGDVRRNDSGHLQARVRP